MSPPGPGRLGEVRRGRVAVFAAEGGAGVVEDDDGGRFAFHCVEIADGTRQIDEGAPLVFHLRPAHGGVLEAAQLVPR